MTISNEETHGKRDSRTTAKGKDGGKALAVGIKKLCFLAMVEWFGMWAFGEMV